MTSPAKQNLTIYQGDDWVQPLDVLNADGTPFDLTGYTAAAQLRRDYADLETEYVDVDVVLESSTVTLSLVHGVVETLTGAYKWDMQIISPAAGVTTLMYGTVTVQPEVTRP